MLLARYVLFAVVLTLVSFGSSTVSVNAQTGVVDFVPNGGFEDMAKPNHLSLTVLIQK